MGTLIETHFSPLDASNPTFRGPTLHDPPSSLFRLEGRRSSIMDRASEFAQHTASARRGSLHLLRTEQVSPFSQVANHSHTSQSPHGLVRPSIPRHITPAFPPRRGSLARPSTGPTVPSGSRHELSDPPTPSYNGYLHDEWDLVFFLEAVLQGRLLHAKRRLHKDERGVIKSGQVWVSNETASGIKRWTDTLDWSPSRQLGAFLIYREVHKSEEKKKLLSDERRISQKRKFSETQDGIESSSNGTAVGGKTNPKLAMVRNAKGEERKLEDYFGALIDQYDYVENGLVKKAITIEFPPTKSGEPGHLHHVICYYSLDDVINDRLQRPSLDPALNTLHPRPPLRDNVRIANLLRQRPLPPGHPLAELGWQMGYPPQYIGGVVPYQFSGYRPYTQEYFPATSLSTHVQDSAPPSSTPVQQQPPAYPVSSSAHYQFQGATSHAPGYALPHQQYSTVSPIDPRSSNFERINYPTSATASPAHEYPPQEQYNIPAIPPTIDAHSHQTEASNPSSVGNSASAPRQIRYTESGQAEPIPAQASTEQDPSHFPQESTNYAYWDSVGATYPYEQQYSNPAPGYFPQQ